MSIRAPHPENTTTCRRDGNVGHIMSNMDLFDHEWVSTKLPQPMASIHALCCLDDDLALSSPW